MNKLIDLTKAEVESSILAGSIGPKTTESLQPSTLCNKKLIWLTCCLLMTRVSKRIPKLSPLQDGDKIG